jgi:hypothetical protein
MGRGHLFYIGTGFASKILCVFLMSLERMAALYAYLIVKHVVCTFTNKQNRRAFDIIYRPT